MFRSPQALAIMTVLIWSFGSSITKSISTSSVFLALTLSIALSSVSFALIAVRKNPASLRVAPRTALKYVLIGSFGYGCYWIAYTQSFRHSNSAATTAVLNYTWPLFTVLFTEILAGSSGSRFTKCIQWAGIVVGTASIWLLVTRGALLSSLIYDPIAIMWGIGAGLSYGLFGALSASIERDKQVSFLFYASAGSSLILTPFAVSEIGLLWTFSWSTIVVILLSGVLVDGLGYFTWTMANRVAREQSIDIFKISSITLALPFLSTLIISFLYVEYDFMEPYFIFAILLLTLASLLCQQGERIKRLLLGNG